MSKCVLKSRRAELIALLEAKAVNPAKGLPEDVFLFASRLVPLINVDLLIKNRTGQTLLAWRDNGCWRPGWHIPGGVIRFRETASDRIRAVAKLELGATVNFEKAPLLITEFILPQKSPAHTLFPCFTDVPCQGAWIKKECTGAGIQNLGNGPGTLFVRTICCLRIAYTGSIYRF